MTECKYCEKDVPKNIKMHERFCKMNPNRLKSKIKDARSANGLLMCEESLSASNEEKSQSSSIKQEKQMQPAGAPNKPGKSINIVKTKLDTHDTLQSPRDTAGDNTSDSYSPSPVVNNDVKQEIDKKKTRIYFILVGVFIFAGFLQYFLFTWLKVHWIFIFVSWIVDILILAFLIWTVYKLRKKQEIEFFEDMEEFVKKVPKWAINEKSPKSGLIGSILNKGKEYKQLVFVSENFEPKAVWAEWDGFLFRIGNRAYKPARDVRGDLFLYHVDKKMPLIDAAEATAEDAEDSYHLLATWNQAFAVGHAAALNETQQQVKMILMIVAIILVAVVALAIYQYSQFEAINQKFIIAEKLINQMAAEGIKVKP